MIDEHDIERLKEIFVTRRECQDTTDGFNKKLNNDNVRLAVIEAQLNQVKWLLRTVLAATLVNLANSLFNLIGG